MVRSSHCLASQSVPLPWSAAVRHLTQKPAREIHLDSNLKATAAVGRINNGTDAPMTSALRDCISSLGGRVSGSSDIFST